MHRPSQRRTALGRSFRARAWAATATGCVLALAVAGCNASSPSGPRSSPRPETTSPAGTSAPAETSDPSTATPATPTTSQPAETSGLPHPDHIVVVLMENHSYSQVIGSPVAPYLSRLASTGASFTQSYAITHPSQPNYLALFSGSTHGVTDDSCPHRYPGPDLGSQVRAGGGSFVGYAESLPRAGYTGCRHGDYARKHAPWTDFADLPASLNQPFSAFPTDYHQLPTVAFVIPNLQHDMHNGTIAQGDRWVRRNLGRYARWATSHNSLLVITWDEDDDTPTNRIPTIVTGAHVTAGRYAEHLTQYRMLRTIEAVERLAPLGAAARTRPVRDIWTS